MKKKTLLVVISLFAISLLLVASFSTYAMRIGEGDSRDKTAAAESRQQHLYVIASSGQVLMYFVVDGGVSSCDGIFLCWQDIDGSKHRQLVSSQQIIHISNRPLKTRGNMVDSGIVSK